ncbi:Spy/CpxP family protein refolding chaperone [Bernardetia sp.]|uniref:Spy/CpxP family protein refolding chaperone n=1 Tax=Bernardetia sp. TaxID=1937974 RepID=UPI0025C33A79|nr:Spy/CpxP family protein refolding chaperone [Bernardetia sp.]
MKIIQKTAIFFTLSLALFFAFSITTYAQRGEGKHGKHHEERLEKMKEELDLSDAQVEQIKALHEKKREEMKKLRSEAKEENEERRAKMKAHHKEMKAEIDKILTPEQRKKAEALRAEHKDPEKRAEKRLEKLKSELSLTDAQASKVKSALVTKMTKMQALKEAAGEERVNKDERKALHTAFENELKSILSDEQFKKYEEIKAEKKGKHKHKKHKK